MTALGAAEPHIASATRCSRSRLRISRSVEDLRAEARFARRAGRSIGLVPTMGALHEGHLSLIRAARERCELVVVSLFVNPTQFDERADLERYPRQEARDAALAQSAGADLLFAPPAEEIYRPGFATAVEVHGLTDRLEGAVRGRGHFRGVTTIVCKLLNIVTPDIAFFGQKDAQQAAVIRRMVADLDIDVRIETLPTVREPDGLAMSSRNARLTAAERRRAPALHAALAAAADRVAAGERSAARLIETVREVLASHAVAHEYVALVDQDSFDDLHSLREAGLLLIAARIGDTRLIDNLVLRVPAASCGTQAPDRHPKRDRRSREGDVIAACSA